MRSVTACAAFFLLCASLVAQQAVEDQKTRVLITDSNSWEEHGGFAANRQGAVGFSSGGARPQTAEVIRTWGERCPTITVTRNEENADYILLLDHEGGKGLARKDNKFALFNKEGDAIASGSTRSLGNAVKDACDAVLKELKSRK